MDYPKILGSVKSSLPVIIVLNGSNKIISKGSGFIYQQEDIIVTCAHVVAVTDESTNVMVRFSDSEEFISAKVVLTDTDHDIALLKFQSDKKRSPLSAAKNEAAEGENVMLCGYPFSLMDLTTHQGIVAAVITDPTGMRRYLLDGTVNPGNSGGPLLNQDGHVIGVVDATRRESNDVLSKVRTMNSGALSLHGLDLVDLYNALVDNLQLGIGYAVPSAYIPTYPTGPVTKKPVGTIKTKEPTKEAS